MTQKNYNMYIDNTCLYLFDWFLEAFLVVNHEILYWHTLVAGGLDTLHAEYVYDF